MFVFLIFLWMEYQPEIVWKFYLPRLWTLRLAESPPHYQMCHSAAKTLALPDGSWLSWSDSWSAGGLYRWPTQRKGGREESLYQLLKGAIARSATIPGFLAIKMCIFAKSGYFWVQRNGTLAENSETTFSCQHTQKLWNCHLFWVFTTFVCILNQFLNWVKFGPFLAVFLWAQTKN